MGNKFRLHTPEELENIARTDFKRFKEFSKYYLENDNEYFLTYCLPLLKSSEEQKEIKESDITEKLYSEYSDKELETIAKNNYERLKLISKQAYDTLI